ncbi:MAG: hypothetical protein Q4G68_06325 [Planctomycetia bacterium]|nr:hypothetical protein [Planctomycetia bacterium]
MVKKEICGLNYFLPHYNIKSNAIHKIDFPQYPDPAESVYLFVYAPAFSGRVDSAWLLLDLESLGFDVRPRRAERPGPVWQSERRLPCGSFFNE